MKSNSPSFDYITTYSGGKFYYHHPKDSTITIRDIAHALGNTCRFGGHTREFYSVAQHSVLVSRLLDHDDELALHGLMHDAAEAFCCDLPSPCKSRCNGEYSRMEKECMEAIYEILGLPAPSQGQLEEVKHADRAALVNEAMAFLTDYRWVYEFPPYVLVPLDEIVPWSPRDAKVNFWLRYDYLTGATIENLTVA